MNNKFTKLNGRKCKAFPISNGMKKFTKNKQGGYAVLETIFYIALFAILSMAVISAIVAMGKSYSTAAASAELMQNSAIMERMSREIRQANAINTISATSLKLDTKDEAGTAKTIRFTLSGTNIELYDNDALVGNMNTPNSPITALLFTEITTAKGKAVKVSFTAQNSRGGITRTESFYDTVVLRGDYGI